MSNKIKLAEKYSKIANLLDEVGEHEVADACTYIVNRLASDKSFVKEAFNLGGLGRSLGNIGKNFLQGGGGGLLGGLMGSLFPGQKQGRGSIPFNPQLAAAMKNLSVLDPTVSGPLITDFANKVTLAVNAAKSAAATVKPATTPATTPVSSPAASSPAAQ